MTKNKPPSRRVIARSAESDPRDLRTPPPTLAERAALAEKANFGPYSKHKKNPSAYKLQPYAGEDEDPTYTGEVNRTVEYVKRGDKYAPTTPIDDLPVC